MKPMLPLDLQYHHKDGVETRPVNKIVTLASEPMDVSGYLLTENVTGHLHSLLMSFDDFHPQHFGLSDSTHMIFV